MSKRLTLLTLLAFTLVLLPGAVVRAAEDAEPSPAVEEFDLGPDTSDTSSIVCRTGHWLSGPRRCQRQHVDSVIGPLAPCSYIKLGGIWYHIEYVIGSVVGVTKTVGTPVPEGSPAPED
jgi:hypothetical protein